MIPTNITTQVSTEFILSTLGPYGKYSSCLYPTGRETLAEAESLMLESYCAKAHLKDGLDILDLGCGESIFTRRFRLKTNELALHIGWGSLSLFLAEVSFYKLCTFLLKIPFTDRNIRIRI